MENINAFVGHSFDDSDKEIVRVFNDYFTTLSKSAGLNFFWDHAEEAQTMAISKKVKEKITGKNLFIGIFTKKERVIKDYLLVKGWLLNTNKLMSDESNYEWKTSDWVLQELGYCLGKDMSAIILLEKGVRPISGLQADHEYIEFDRSNPTLSFEKLLQQISSTSYKTSSDEALAEDSNVSSEEQADVNSSKKNNITDWKNPELSWDDFDYWVGLFIAVSDKDKDTEHKIYSAYIKKYDGKLSQIAIWEADYLLLKQKHLNESAIAPIKTLIEDNPTVIDLYGKLAKAYEGFNSYDLAFEASEIALISTQEFKMDNLVQAVDLLKKHKGSEFARNYLRQYLYKIPDNQNDKCKFFTLYGKLYKEDFPNVFFSLSEAALAIQPDDSSLRFDLAYKYSELDLFKLSTYHYKILAQTSPSDNNWNNLGVAYGNLNINTKSIDAYIKSSNLEGTLAKSNLANKLLSIGFAQQAMDLCKQAMTKDNYDKRVTASLEAVNEKLEADDKLDALISEDTKLAREFSISFAKAIANTTTNIKAGLYKYKDCNLDVTISGNQFVAYGVYEKEISTTGFGIGLLAASLSQSSKKIEHHKITLVGEIQGDGIIAKINKESDNKTLLGGIESSKDASIYYSKDEQCFYVAEFSSMNEQIVTYKISLI